MTLDPRITFSRASLATYYDSAGVLKYAAHNFAWPSEDFTTRWASVGGGTVTADATAAPTGAVTADRLNATTAPAEGGGVTLALTPVPTYRGIFSVYAKAGSKTFLRLALATITAANYCYFNLATGVVGTRGANWLATGMIDAGNGWYRCWGMVAANATFYIRVAEVDNSQNISTAGDLYIWGVQFEHVMAETTPGAYIPTTTAVYHAPRFDYDPVTHVAKGLLIEEARTNVVLQNRDLTAAAWTKTSCTAAKNQTGLDGAANSASSLTASGANATCLQVITLASSARYQSAYVKRITGSGVVNMTMNGGTTWTPVTVTTNWTRVEIPTATLANPSVGFQIVTSGDAIAVDCVQNENGAFATSAIPTTTVAVARVADVAVMTGTNFSSWYNQPAGTFVAEFQLLPGVIGVTGNRVALSADNTSTAQSIILYRNVSNVARTDVTAVSAMYSSNVGTVVAGVNKLGLSATLNDFAACLNGGTVVLDTLGSMPTPTQMRIGWDGQGTNYLNGHIRKIKFSNVAKSDVDLQTLTT